MKNIAILSLLFSSLAFAAETPTAKPLTVNPYSSLEGTWTGKVTKNFKILAAGGKPAPASVDAPAKIVLNKTATGLTGTSTTGGDTESWVIDGNTYTWTDSDMAVSSTATTKLPAWVQSEIAISGNDQVFAFTYSSCTDQKTKKACDPKSLPGGLDKGYWILKVNGSKLTSAVLYQYPTGGTRHLSEELSKN